MYLAAFFGGGAVMVLSGFVGDAALSSDEVARVVSTGPAYLGLAVAVALLVGVRSGAEGGPLAIEAADARYLLQAPLPRRAVLRRPLLQRFRTIAGGGAVGGAMAGVLAAQRLPGDTAAWVASGAAFGAALGLVVVAPAVLTHAMGLPAWAASIGVAGFGGWQLWAALGEHHGPFDTLGDLALWGDRPRTVDLAAVAVVAAAVVGALLLVGRLRVEHLDRRGSLVSQLRFAVTTQDLRTVVLLRRQMRQERPRSRPLLHVPSFPGGHRSTAVIERSLRSLVRSPVSRVGRIAALGAGAGVAAALAAEGTTPAIVVCGILLFIMGLDLVEPLAQEVDHPDRSESLPLESGWLHLRLLTGPALAAVIPAAAGALACVVVAPSTWPAACALALPITWAGMTGSIVNVVRDERISGSAESVMVPPEMSGMKNVLVLLVPLIVSTIGPAAILAAREQPLAAVVGQLVVLLGVYVVAFGYWVRRRSEWAAKFSAIKKEAMP